MDIVKAFEKNKLNIHITIMGTHEEPLFRASDIGAILDISTIRSTIRDFDITEKVVHIMDTPGGPQEVTFLTEDGLYELLFRSRKPIAKKFKKWVRTVIKEIRLNGKYELEQLLKDSHIENQKNIIDNFKNKQVVYLIKVGENIIKFGISKNIEKRFREHKLEFGDDIVLKTVFETVYNREFELMIKNNEIIKKHIIEKTYKNNQTELIELKEDFTYNDLKKELDIIKEKVNGELLINLINRNKELELELATYKNQEIKKELQDRTLALNNINAPVYPEDNMPKNNQARIQLYDKDKKLIKTYETIRDATNEKILFKGAVSQQVHRSSNNNTLYKGYRFFAIDRNKEVKEYPIPDTVELSKKQSYERIVKISKNNEIIKIYSSTKDASKELFEKIKSGDFVPKNTKLKQSTVKQINKSITNSLSEHTNHVAYEYLWYRESNVPKDLLGKFETYKKNNILPELAINKYSKKIYKYDSDNTLIYEYKTIAEALKNEKVGSETLKKCIAEDTLLNGHYFSFELLEFEEID